MTIKIILQKYNKKYNIQDNVINLTNRFIAVVEASPVDFVIPREFSTWLYWLYGFDKDFMKLRYQ
ncbi:MAG: hypothetical protein ISS28_04860 [Candidatus Cloacimonetes bacterium]|nr:hypothetical protein [Candidatus Cloacimonadota bacterium]